MSADAGNDVFLGQRFQAVGEGLQEAEGADAVGSVAVLDAAQSLALKQVVMAKSDGKTTRMGTTERMRRTTGWSGGRHMAQHPVLEHDEDLIERQAFSSPPTG